MKQIFFSLPLWGFFLFSTWGHTKIPYSPPLQPTSTPQPKLIEGYAPDEASLSDAARRFEQKPSGLYSYLMRATFFYECITFGMDNQPVKKTEKKSFLGTTFAFTKKQGKVFFLTTDHLIRSGYTQAGKAKQSLTSNCRVEKVVYALMSNGNDTKEEDDFLLNLVSEEKNLDAAILSGEDKFSNRLEVLPYSITPSFKPKISDFVFIRGFLVEYESAIPATVIASEPTNPKPIFVWGLEFKPSVFFANVSHAYSLEGSPVLAIHPQNRSFELIGMVMTSGTPDRDYIIILHTDQLLPWIKKSLENILTPQKE